MSDKQAAKDDEVRYDRERDRVNPYTVEDLKLEEKEAEEVKGGMGINRIVITDG